MAFDPSNVLDLSTDNAERANTLKTELTKDESFTPVSIPDWKDLPDIPAASFSPVTIPTDILPKLESVTAGSKSIDGNGAFDIFMQAIKAHLIDMKERGLLNDSAIASVLVGVIPPVLQEGVSWALECPRVSVEAALAANQAQAAYWESVASEQKAYATQAEAYTARVNAQVAVASLELELSNIGLTKMKMLESNEQCNLVKIQGEIANSQVSDTLSNGQPIGGSIARDNAIKEWQAKNLAEQIEVQKEQIRLYQYQEKAYDLDGKIKVVSIWSANYQTLIANGTLDKVPDCLNLDNTNAIFTKLSNVAGLAGKDGVDGVNALG